MNKSVLMITNFFYPHIGGVERHVEKLSETLILRGYKVAVLTSRYRKDQKTYEKLKNINVYRFGYPKIKFIGLLAIWLNMARYVRLVRKYGIIHIHDVVIWYIPLKILFPRKFIYATFHGYEKYPIPKKNILIKKLSARIANKYIVIGKYVNKYYGLKSKIILYGGIDKKYLNEVSINKIYDIVLVGKLEDDYGAANYFRAIKSLKEKKDYKILILGKGRYAEDFRKIGVDVKFVKHPETYLQKCRVAYATSYLSIMEAMAHRLPVVATYQNNLRKDMLKHSPFKKLIWIEENPKNIVRVTEMLLKERGHVRRKKAYLWIKKQTWENVANSYIRVWKK